MSENLTKKTSATQPTRRFPARGAIDDGVHVVEAAPVDLVDPSALHTYCGQRVLEVYNDGREPTCERCASSADRP
jgi:hypothetical protein